MPRLITVALALSLLLNAFFVAGFVFRGWIADLCRSSSASPPPPPPPPAGATERARGRGRRSQSRSPAASGAARRLRAARPGAARALARDAEGARADRRRIQALAARSGPARPVDRPDGRPARRPAEGDGARAGADGGPARPRAAREDAPDPGRPPPVAARGRANRGRRRHRARRSRRHPMVAPIGRRGFVVRAAGAAALSAGLWPPRPGMPPRRWISTRRGICCRARPSAPRRRRSARSRPRITPPPSIGCWPACAATPSRRRRAG